MKIELEEQTLEDIVKYLSFCRAGYERDAEDQEKSAEATLTATHYYDEDERSRFFNDWKEFASESRSHAERINELIKAIDQARK